MPKSQYFRYIKDARIEASKMRKQTGQRVIIRRLSSTERKAHPKSNYKVASY